MFKMFRVHQLDTVAREPSWLSTEAHLLSSQTIMRLTTTRALLYFIFVLMLFGTYVIVTLTTTSNVEGGQSTLPLPSPDETELAVNSINVPAVVHFAPLTVVGKRKYPIDRNSTTVMTTDDSLAGELTRRIRILCWIAVTSKTMDRAAVILETWGRRCTKILLIGDDTTSETEGVVRLSVKEGRDRLWPKTREAFRYLYANHLDEADWFLKADTDTYVIMENLRLLLSQRNIDDPAYIGCTINMYTTQGYNSGGAGYVLNKASLKQLVTKAFKDTTCEQGFMEDEDVSLGHCMGVVGIKPGDPTDVLGKNRFFPFEPADHIDHEKPNGNIWYWSSSVMPGPKSMDCCSDTVISFHYVNKKLMWNMEFLLYHAKVFGISTSFDIT